MFFFFFKFLLLCSFAAEPVTIDVANPIVLFQRYFNLDLVYGTNVLISGWLDEFFDETATHPTEIPNLSNSIPMNLAQGLRAEAAQGLLEILRAGMRQEPEQKNDALTVLHYALFVVGILTEQSVDDGTFGYCYYYTFCSIKLTVNRRPATTQAIIAYQKANGLNETVGHADVETLTAIFKQARGIIKEQEQEKERERAKRREKVQIANIMILVVPSNIVTR